MRVFFASIFLLFVVLLVGILTPFFDVLGNLKTMIITAVVFIAMMILLKELF